MLQVKEMETNTNQYLMMKEATKIKKQEDKMKGLHNEGRVRENTNLAHVIKKNLRCKEVPNLV